jgi:NAD(P)H-hydrate epimerase
VHAEATISFIGLKRGLLTGDAPDCVGELYFDDLGVPDAVYAEVEPVARLLDAGDADPLLGPRRRTAHKGAFGHVLVIGGDHGMGGAARMAAEAAARVGAGLTSVATRAPHLPAITAGRPELMVSAVEDPGELEPLLNRATVIAIGPGLGRGAWSRALLSRVLESDRALVLDADALSLLAEEPLRREDWILTPHPGEAARLLGVKVAEVQADRYSAVAALRERYGGTCVLKGAGTLIHDAGPTGVCAAGNPGMASGGMGDVLTGVIAGLRAQGLERGQAARVGVCLHASAADRAAAQGGERGLLATDLCPELRRLVNP